MNKLEFRIIEAKDDYKPVGLPLNIYRFVKENKSGKLITVDDELENPDNTDFFIVWENVNDKCVCQYHNKFIVARILADTGFSKFSMPLIKKTYPKLIADALVGVQPMAGPTALVYYLRYLNAQTKSTPASPDDK